jgi:chemotaxis protein CheX
LDAKLLNPFIEAIFQVFPQLGIQDLKRGAVRIEEKLTSTLDVLVIVGLSGKVRGSVGFNMNEATAKNMASAMMMGMPVESIDEMSISAISEMANMTAGTATTLLSSVVGPVDISPPTLIVGENLRARVSRVKTVCVEIDSSIGKTELKLGLEY